MKFWFRIRTFSQWEKTEWTALDGSNLERGTVEVSPCFEDG